MNWQKRMGRSNVKQWQNVDISMNEHLMVKSSDDSDNPIAIKFYNVNSVDWYSSKEAEPYRLFQSLNENQVHFSLSIWSI